MEISRVGPHPLLKIKLKFRNVGFCEGRKTEEPSEKPWSRDENQQQVIQPTNDVNSGRS